MDTALQPGRIEYPERDGKPVGETDFHIAVIFYLRQALALHLRDQPNMYVAANMFLYYEEGNPQAVVCPDVFVVRGVPKRKRRTFKTWEEGAGPCVVIEVTSLSSRIEDLGNKRALYEMLGVREYFLYDPMGEYLRPALRGFRRVGEQFRELKPAANGALRSLELALILRAEGDSLRLIDSVTGEKLPGLDEAVDLARAAQRRAEAEAKRAETEAKRAETEAKRAETEAKRAETEAKRAEDEIKRAEAEAKRADRAERELAKLRAQLQGRGKRP
ncbi:MAG: Uma2 family endonuclease [Deltaproteobacteria bacterium]|nr:Uma2 family endonuclease [Deltaproteobacteria bacterium]